MRDYELTLVIDPDLTGEEEKKLTTKVKKVVLDLKGKVERTTDWGKKELAYPIKKKTQGAYFLWAVKLPAKAPAELDQKLRHEEGLLRCLLVKKD